VELGVDVTVLDNEGNSPMSLLLKNIRLWSKDHHRLVKLLINRGARVVEKEVFVALNEVVSPSFDWSGLRTPAS